MKRPPRAPFPKRSISLPRETTPRDSRTGRSILNFVASPRRWNEKSIELKRFTTKGNGGVWGFPVDEKTRHARIVAMRASNFDRGSSVTLPFVTIQAFMLL